MTDHQKAVLGRARSGQGAFRPQKLQKMRKYFHAKSNSLGVDAYSKEIYKIQQRFIQANPDSQSKQGMMRGDEEHNRRGLGTYQWTGHDRRHSQPQAPAPYSADLHNMQDQSQGANSRAQHRPGEDHPYNLI